jgi:hypothetical protein
LVSAGADLTRTDSETFVFREIKIVLRRTTNPNSEDDKERLGEDFGSGRSWIYRKSHGAGLENDWS